MIGYINLSLGIKLFIVLSILDFIFGYLSDYKNEKNPKLIGFYPLIKQL